MALRKDDAHTRAQKDRNTIFVEDGEILEVQAFPGEQFVQRIRAPKCAAAARPGSFIHITCADALPMRRPLSIMRANEDWIEILFKNVGDGLRALSRKRRRRRGECARPDRPTLQPGPGAPALSALGGGVGIPPMVFLADRLRNDTRYRPLAILGSELPFPFELAPSRLAAPGIDAAAISTMPLLESWGSRPGSRASPATRAATMVSLPTSPTAGSGD